MKRHLPFLISATILLVGLTILAYLPVRKLYQFGHAQFWIEIPAQVTEAKLRYGHLSRGSGGRNRGRRKPAYEATGTYAYRFNGVAYTGTRLTLHDGLSTDREAQAARVSRLKSHIRRKTPVVAYVNSSNPSQAVLERGADWFGIAMGGILGLVFSAIGWGMLGYVRQTR